MDISKVDPALVTQVANFIASVVESGDKNAIINLRLYALASEIGMEAAFDKLFGKTITLDKFASELYQELAA